MFYHLKGNTNYKQLGNLLGTYRINVLQRRPIVLSPAGYLIAHFNTTLEIHDPVAKEELGTKRRFEQFEQFPILPFYCTPV